mmetsp:Transcript_49232/g.120017  ORF Transcript_49232/g.120017 Transcript_49232/m.120017 type:complete len:218 (+) Transcript_49232:1377-2030(+)
MRAKGPASMGPQETVFVHQDSEPLIPFPLLLRLLRPHDGLHIPVVGVKEAIIGPFLCSHIRSCHRQEIESLLQRCSVVESFLLHSALDLVLQFGSFRSQGLRSACSLVVLLLHRELDSHGTPLNLIHVRHQFLEQILSGLSAFAGDAIRPQKSPRLLLRQCQHITCSKLPRWNTLQTFGRDGAHASLCSAPRPRHERGRSQRGPPSSRLGVVHTHAL